MSIGMGHFVRMQSTGFLTKDSLVHINNAQGGGGLPISKRVGSLSYLEGAKKWFWKILGCSASQGLHA